MRPDVAPQFGHRAWSGYSFTDAVGSRWFIDQRPTSDRTEPSAPALRAAWTRTAFARLNNAGETYWK